MIAPANKLRIIVGGLVGQFPLGGVAWDYFHYCIGLAALGHEVVYHEDTWIWPHNPQQGYPTDDPAYTTNFIQHFFETYAPTLSTCWHYLLLHETHCGMTESAFDAFAASADLFINVSGACFFPDKLNPKALKVFMDTDPGYNQIVMHQRPAWSENVDNWIAQIHQHDRHLTYAENIYGSDCVIPRMGLDWRVTRPIVALPSWDDVRRAPVPANAPMTTVMSWSYFPGPLTLNGISYSSKAEEYAKFHDLPRHVNVSLALAIAGHKQPSNELKRDGWLELEGTRLSLTPEGYMKLIAESSGEWSIAKNVYVATRSGWFSCRTACYLAAGRPCVVQDTGWSRYLPSGAGVIAFDTMEQTIAGLNDVRDRYGFHRAAAYEIAREYLAPDRVLPPMIEAIYDTGPTGTAPRPPSLEGATS